jgi:hypothetical protein
MATYTGLAPTATAADPAAQQSQAAVVTGITANYKEALHAVDELRSHVGLSDEDISILARHPDPPSNSLHGTPGGTPEPQDEKSIGKGAAGGAVVGGVGGLALGVGSLLIPGLGPLIASGLFLGALSGAATGAAAGGLVGVLKDQGLPEDRAHQYGERLHKGEVIVSARVRGEQIEPARQILERYEELANRPL